MQQNAATEYSSLGFMFRILRLFNANSTVSLKVGHNHFHALSCSVLTRLPATRRYQLKAALNEP